MPGDIPPSLPERAFLLGLQHQALRYFLDNQLPDGLVLDRQANHAPLRSAGWCSTSSTGMGLIALALASAEPYRLLSIAESLRRIRTALETALEGLPCDHGILPHFLDSATNEPRGHDVFSTIDTSWLATGALWSAAFLHDADLTALADRLYDRIDWLYWALPAGPGQGLLRHGKGGDGRFLPIVWDRLNGETVFMDVLAAGAAAERALPRDCSSAWRPFTGTVAGLRFNNADLGLYVFEYGMDLLDLRRWRTPDGVDLAAEARRATRANYLACREAAATFITYRRFWGLSDGDGPGDSPGTDVYRTYAPGALLDGTAHISATTAAVANAPGEVMENLLEADGDAKLGARGRYGFSNVNLDRNWISRDVVGIDAGAIALALDNYLMADRVRNVFHSLPCVARGLERLGFRPTEER